MPCGTLRAWFLAFVLSTAAGGVNTILYLRYPAPILTPIVMLLVAYPLGKLMAAVLPIRTFHFSLPYWTPRSSGLYPVSFSLNPGLFNIKEHTLITIVLNLVINQAYALHCVLNLNSPYFYDSPKPVMFAILFTVSSQMIGFAFAGVSRRFLVTPASMIWPQVLVITTVLNTLHAEEDGYDGTTSRLKFFSLILIGISLWEFVPQYLFTALSSFNWLCWIWPSSYFVNFFFGNNSGLGLSVLTFDWTQVNYIGSPLVYPWWAECNIFGGYVLWIMIVGPILYFTNTLYTAYLPYNTATAYDNTGSPYNKSIIVTSDLKFDEAAYQAYSPLFLSTTYLMVYMCGFAVFTGILSHTVLYHGKALMRGIRQRKTEEDDIHAKLMRRYAEVPEWWYFLIGVIMFALAVITVEVYDVGLPIWALFVSIVLPAVYFLPSGFIFAMTGTSIGTNLVSEVIAGYAFQGLPIANMIFKVYSYMGLAGGLSFVQDLKLGHYMKVPPRQSFSAQMIFTFWIALVQIAVQQFMRAHVNDLCAVDQAHNFSCPQARVFFTSSIFWGVIGPRRLFGDRGLYAPLYWAMLIGLALPVPFWLLARKYPKSWVKYVSVPIILNATVYIPPASGIVYVSWFVVAFVFQYLIRKYNFRWWSKYNFVTSAALDSGTIFATIFIFLFLQLPKDGRITLNWWGNTVAYNNLDANPIAWRPTPPQGFGPGR
jgi:OPT family small oligopeptide transporter